MSITGKIDLQKLKQQICTGDEDAIRQLTEYFFPEIWANMLAGKFDEQVDALINLELDLRNNFDDFCKAENDIEIYLRKKWKEKLVGLRKKTISFDGAFMGTEKPEEKEEISSAIHSMLPFQYNYFFHALDPITRMLFETKYFQNLNGRNGLFQVSFFLLNVTSIAQDKLQFLLDKNSILQEPLISNTLIQTSKNVFTNQVIDQQQSLSDFLQNLPNNKKLLKKAFHSYEMKLFRMHNRFKELLTELKKLSLLEQTIVLINQYLPIEHIIEIWVRLNIDSQQNQLLKKELVKAGLSSEEVKQKHETHRAKALMKTLKTGKYFLDNLTKHFQEMQNNINQKLNNPIVWKTN